MKTMKKMFAMAFVAVVGLAGCQQELVGPDAVESDALKVFATIEDADDTRTSLNDREVYWSSGDRIAVFMNKTLRKRFEVSSESVGTKEGTFLYDSDYIVTGKSVAISNNVAYYPFCEVTCAVSGSTYTLSNVTLPSTQNYSSASFGQDAFPMVAVTADTDDLDFAFRNLCGVLAFQLKGSGTVRSITVKGNSDEILSGKATVTASFGKNPEISLLPDGSKTVTLDCGETGVALQNDTPTSFYIVLPPVAFDNGFTVTVTDAAGATKEYSTTKKNAILRSGILRMPEKEYVSERVPQEGDYIDEYGINHGQGVKIGETVWAPVNCGYHATDYAYGKLYQWGRKYGQGYKGSIGEYWMDSGEYSDAYVPAIVAGPVTLAAGQSESNADKFYSSQYDPHDWCSTQYDNLWNLGTAKEPVKTEYDPCPDGWRISTYIEQQELTANYFSYVATEENEQNGVWCSGPESYSSEAPQIFLPAAALLGYVDGRGSGRGTYGEYWSSSFGDYHLFIDNWSCSVVSGMPHAGGLSVRCVQDDSALIPVESLTLNKTSLPLSLGASETLSSTIIPSNANHKSAHWWSDNPEVAIVDQNGNVTAVSKGSTSIHAMAGMQLATCEVTVDAADYIDEYGVNHGSGVKIGETVWAPVNCGYHATDFKYGKLYQWGRKYGQGYSGDIFDVNVNYVGEVSDATVPAIEDGGISAITGQHKSNANVFYTSSSEYNYDWLYPRDDKLWNSGSESNPLKTEYDPCPEGWRVPTYAELDELNNNYSSWTTNENGQPGCWFSGASSYTETVPQVFFPAAGRLNHNDGTAYGRGCICGYWSSRPGNADAYGLGIGGRFVDVDNDCRASGYSVRCVQDDSMLIPVESITLNKTSLSLVVGFSETLSSNISPSNANHKYTHWWSDNPEVAIVDQGGNVTAVASGTATVYAMAGMQVATCEVTVKDAAPSIDYIDEYGINHGVGVRINETVWAPVNCGYHATDFKYGKLYQWGRKYGQGYSGQLTDGSWNVIGEYSDASVPEIKEGRVSLLDGQSELNANVFFLWDYENFQDWVYPSYDELWNSGAESDPEKTEYDPCPEGWRVPTYAELEELSQNYSSWTTNNKGQNGCWFSGSTLYQSSIPQVFFPAAGDRGYGGGSEDGGSYVRGSFGYYWSSRPEYSNFLVYGLFLASDFVEMKGLYRRAYGHSVRCVQDDTELIPVSSVTLSKASLSLSAGASETLSSTITPSNANHQSAHWWSDNPEIASVDQNGNVAGVSKGTTTIYAMAGMQVATCEVTVKADSQEGDYIDEYGINHGQGVKIGETVWAPVNCGYHATDYAYGKLYQWGRKYGQGYDENDASVPTIEDGGISVITGQHKDKANVFFTSTSEFNYDWCNPQKDKLWNSGSESNPVKTEYDPCPDGWRVPTYAELDELDNNYSSWTTADNGQMGRWFSGPNSYTATVPQVFFPAAGFRSDCDGDAGGRGYFGYYWSSRPSNTYAVSLYFFSSSVYMSSYGRASGYSVRCVQAND